MPHCGAYRAEPAAVDAWIVACQEFGAGGSETTTRSPSPPATAAPRRAAAGAALPVAVIEKRERRRREGKTYSVYRVRWYEADGRERSRTLDSRADAKAFDARCARSRAFVRDPARPRGAPLDRGDRSAARAQPDDVPLDVSARTRRAAGGAARSRRAPDPACSRRRPDAAEKPPSRQLSLGDLGL
jgi:hypothetical protein